MASRLLHLASIWLVGLVLLRGRLRKEAYAEPLPPPLPCEPPLIVFGASLTDVGENAAAMPLRSSSEFPPFGLDYFHRPASRYSNGRLFIDFISQELGYGFLHPFLKSVGADFKHGVDFASSGSTARNTTLSGDGSDSSGLFSLMVQIDQFIEFKKAVLEVESNDTGNFIQNLPSSQDLESAIYLIETAHNDYLSILFGTLELDYLAFVENTTTYIGDALKALYREGARNIITMNLVPLGCMPSILNAHPNATRDKYGCLVIINDVVDLHNARLAELLTELQLQMDGSNLILFDANSILLDAFHYPSKYGIKHPFENCCGIVGRRDLENQVHCGKEEYIDGYLIEAKRCEDPSLHIIWDYIHPVESFNYYIAQGVLTGSHLKPYFNIKESCEMLK